MRKMTFSLDSYEAEILWRFFDSVSYAVSTRMLRGSPPGEENLTFLLCELLDESSTALHVLDYPLSRAKEDLEKSDAGLTVDIGFETHEHTKPFESRYSGADLGIVLSINHPVLAHSRRAFLVQAKKLFGNGRSSEFSLYSEYSSYDKEQASFLQELQTGFEVRNSVFYLWYNPPSSGFSEKEAKHIRAYETQSWSIIPSKMGVYLDLDDLIDIGIPVFHSGNNLLNARNQESEDKAREWRTRQPATRITDLNTVLSLTKDGHPPRLKPLYDTLMARSNPTCFSPFASFFLLALCNPQYGSPNPLWIQLAEGKKVSLGSLKKAIPRLEQRQTLPPPRHTITISVNSTLPPIG